MFFIDFTNVDKTTVDQVGNVAFLMFSPCKSISNLYIVDGSL